MPRLVRFANAEIAMFFADHNPPHVHVLGRDGAAQVAIETLEVTVMGGRVDLTRGVGMGGGEPRFAAREVE